MGIYHLNMHKVIFQSLFVLLSAVGLVGCGENPNSPAGVELGSEPSIDDGCALPGSASTTISVLFIGNSLTNGVPGKVTSLLECGGYTAQTGPSTPGGYKLYQHDEYGATLNLIAQGFDKVVLQEQSAGIHNWHSEPYPVIASLQTKIEAAGSEMVFYQTWGYDGYSRDYHIAGYDAVGTYFSAMVVAVGRAWKTYEETHAVDPPFSLFSDDRHASVFGQSLIAYVFYAYLTDASPVDRSSLTLSDADALILQTIAWQIYQSYP